MPTNQIVSQTHASDQYPIGRRIRRTRPSLPPGGAAAEPSTSLFAIPLPLSPLRDPSRRAVAPRTVSVAPGVPAGRRDGHDGRSRPAGDGQALVDEVAPDVAAARGAETNAVLARLNELRTSSGRAQDEVELLTGTPEPDIVG